jgi:hypothetical protein
MAAAAPPEPTRFVGLDLHKDYVVLGAVDAKHVCLRPSAGRKL